MGEFELLNEDEPLPLRMDRHAFDRLIMLSDGVFSIAMTLSALEIRPPANWNEAPATLLQMMGPPLICYAIAFGVISAYWMAHRRMISRLRRIDGPATVLNLIFLSLIALQPAAIRLLTEYRANGGAGHIYLGQVALMGFTQASLWVYAWFIGDLIDPSIRRPARVFLLVNVMLWPPLVTWTVLSLRRDAGLETLAPVAIVALASLARHRLGKRLGL